MPGTQHSIFHIGLGRTAANVAPLTPIGFLPRAAAIHPDRVAVIHGDRRITYRELHARASRLAGALAKRGIGAGDTVSAMLPNVPAMLDAHFGVPLVGAVLNTINTRLDARTVAYILEHGEARALITDREYAAVVGPALAGLGKKPLVIDVDDPLYPGPGDRLGELEYEDFLATGPADFPWTPPADESTAIALNYTSGTTGNPKGVVYHHRGAFLESVGTVMAWPLPPRAV
jgi:fatty-acyl-CoA synthase